MTTDVDRSAKTQQLPPAQREPARRPADPEEDETFFRFPAADDPNPGTVKVLTMSAYAALLGLAGVGVGVRGLVSTIGGAPAWYVPALALAGLLSVVLSVAAFLSIHRPLLPWLLLVGAAAPLGFAVALAVAF